MFFLSSSRSSKKAPHPVDTRPSAYDYLRARAGRQGDESMAVSPLFPPVKNERVLLFFN